ncbi:MAG: HAD family hydrolase [Promethearchaeota archaeon]
MFEKIEAVTFDDFNTLRYPVETKEDIIYPILRALKRNLAINDNAFLNEYFKADALYRKNLKETQRESLLDNIILNVLKVCGFQATNIDGIVQNAVEEGIVTRKSLWFPDVKETLQTLRKRGYLLGLISNTHWRISKKPKKEFEKFFNVITLSYEHGLAKPYPSIFLVTLNELKTKPKYCLHVGDDPIADIQGAKNVGMKTAFINRRKIEVNTDIQIKELSELLPFL